MRIGIIAALPGELKPLVKGWKALPVTSKGVSIWRRPSGEDDIFAVCAGMGKDAAVRAFTSIEEHGPLDLVVSIGWAGGLTDQPNLSLVMSEIIDAQTGERFSLTEGGRKLRLVTTAAVANAAEKQRLFKTYGAVVVDMEAATVARLAQMRGIPMTCFKAVSDGVNANLPNINPFIDSAGQLRLFSFLLHVAVRPQHWGSLIEMGRRSGEAASKLAGTVESFLIHKDFERVNRTGEV